MSEDRERAIKANLRAWRRAGRATGFEVADTHDMALATVEQQRIPSLMTRLDQRVLIGLADQVRFGAAIEVGRFAGAVTALLTLCGYKVWSIDKPRTRADLMHHAPRLADRYPGWRMIRDCAAATMADCGLDQAEREWMFADRDSRDPRAWPQRGGYDLVWIDGGHDAETVFSDLNHGWHRLAPGRVMALHDYDLALLVDPASGVDVGFGWWLDRCAEEGTAYDGPFAWTGSSIVWVVKAEG